MVALNNYLCFKRSNGRADEALKLKDVLLELTWGSGPKASSLRSKFGMSGVDAICEMPAELQGKYPKQVQLGKTSMQVIPDQKTVLIGLDCNGFVGVSPNNSIGIWPNRGRRYSLDEVHEFDFAPFNNDSHIVLFGHVLHATDHNL